MGLDMYLNKETFVGFNYEHRRNEDGGVPMTISGKYSHIKPERVSKITEQVGYWRKANAIHEWFVKNVQGGRDECQKSEVSREQLEALLDTVNTVLSSTKLVAGAVINGYTASKETNGELRANIEDGKVLSDTDKAEELLPTQSGCFFGGVNYDQWYYASLVETREILESALAEDGGEFYYQASW